MTFTALAPPISAEAAVAMILTALTMVLIPGPNMIYLASRSVSQGRRAGLISLAGTGLGFIVYMLMANLGLAVVFVSLPLLFIGLKRRASSISHTWPGKPCAPRVAGSSRSAICRAIASAASFAWA